MSISYSNILVYTFHMLHSVIIPYQMTFILTMHKINEWTCLDKHLLLTYFKPYSSLIINIFIIKELAH